MNSHPSRWLSSHALLGACLFGPHADPHAAPQGLVCAAGADDVCVIRFDEAARAEEVAAWARRPDRVWAWESARVPLRQLLAAGIDIARPICLATLGRLLRADGERPAEAPPARDEESARRCALAAFADVAPLLGEIELQQQRRVARLECLVLRPFAALEHRGLPIDRDRWRALVEEARVEADAARQAVFAALGDALPRDLFGEPDLSLESETDLRATIERATGQRLPDLGKQALAALGHPVGPALLRYREAHKIVSTYGEAFLSWVHPRTGRLHATFVPLGASTGRVASRDPNLQNLPGDERFHACIRAPEGRVLVTADYATCELRILAEMSGDPRFLAAFEAGEDLHAAVAQTLFGVPVSKQENPQLRQAAKAINFGLVYGMGPAALAASLSKSLAEAEQLLAQYFARFPRIRGHLEESVDAALARGYAETLLGRRLHFPPDATSAGAKRGEWSRVAKNMPIQGTSADMTKLAMVRLHERLRADFADAGLVNTIHDELVVECSAADGPAVAAAMREEMSAAHQTLLRRVPAEVETHVGPYWHH